LVALGERTTPNGQELLAEFIQYGNQKPFEEIVRRYAGMVFNVCFRITRDKHEAEDAVQAVFLTLALQAKRGADIKALGPWLQQVAKRLSLDIRRGKKRRKTREERHHAEQTLRRETLLCEAIPSADLDELKTVLHEELQKLPAKYRMPLILHYFGGLTREEMAAELNCKPSTLGVRIFRAREMLAGRLSGRGINISSVALAALLGYSVQRTVSEALIASTSYAATALMRGHDASGMASAHVIGLTRHASNAMALGKVKLAAISLLLAGTSLGAGVKALQILPTVNLQRILTNQLQRIIRPLFEPFDRPTFSHAQASQQSSVARPTALANTEPDLTANPAQPAVSIAAASKPVKPPVAPVAASSGSAEPLAGAAASGSTWSYRPTPTAAAASPVSSSTSEDRSSGVTDADVASSPTAGGGYGGSGAAGLTAVHGVNPLPPQSTIALTTQAGRYSNIPLNANDLLVGASEPGALAKTSAPVAMALIPSTGGTVIESSDGTLRGWGTINRTGTLVNNGAVVADGQGVDRTLNLSSFTAVQTDISASTASSIASSTSSSTVSTNRRTFSTSMSSQLPLGSPLYAYPSATAASTTLSSSFAPASNSMTSGSASTAGLLPQSLTSTGWYAVDHGRLCLGLRPSATDSNILTWGDDPDAPALTLTNSVRIDLLDDNAAAASTADSSTLLTTDTAAVPGSSAAAPSTLALLAPDRGDAPDLNQISGAVIGLWQVDPSVGDISDAELSVCYDNLLANDLDAPQDSIALWTFGGASGWQEVGPSSFVLDTMDHTVFGAASDFDYFAVSATPAPGVNVELIRARDLAVINPPAFYENGAPPLQDVTSAPGDFSPATGVPEPVGLPLLVAAALLGRRRVRSRN
jgi:RNA polymerase sigma factor (sigma-70 family)